MSNAENTPIYKDKTVEVTRALVKIGGKSYAMAGIGSVEVTSPQKMGVLDTLIGAGIVSGAAAVFGAQAAIVIGLAVLVFVVFAISKVQKSVLVLRTATGEIQAFKTRKVEYASALKDAIEQALIERG